MSKIEEYSNYLKSRLQAESQLLIDATQFLKDSHNCIAAVLTARNVYDILSEYDVLRTHVFYAVTDVYLISDATLAIESVIEDPENKGFTDSDVIHVPSSWFILWLTDKALWEHDYGKYVENIILPLLEHKSEQVQEKIDLATVQAAEINQTIDRLAQDNVTQQAEETYNNQP